jgi:hypothetical protein
MSSHALQAYSPSKRFLSAVSDLIGRTGADAAFGAEGSGTNCGNIVWRMAPPSSRSHVVQAAKRWLALRDDGHGDQEGFNSADGQAKVWGSCQSPAECQAVRQSGKLAVARYRFWWGLSGLQFSYDRPDCLRFASAVPLLDMCKGCFIVTDWCDPALFYVHAVCITGTGAKYLSLLRTGFWFLTNFCQAVEVDTGLTRARHVGEISFDETRRNKTVVYFCKPDASELDRFECHHEGGQLLLA